jgi:glycerophosphoryl diester phosphodiesterase
MLDQHGTRRAGAEARPALHQRGESMAGNAERERSTAAAVDAVHRLTGAGAASGVPPVPAVPPPRPFYILGHNTNTIEEVQAALELGANAIEPDVNVYLADANALCISHDKAAGNAPSLQAFLTDLRRVAREDERLALVVFDCKTALAKPRHGAALLRAIRTHLSADTGLNVVLSVAELSEFGMFRDIAAGLGPREGLMVDFEDDPVAVSRRFARAAVSNGCYGNGISVLNAQLGPHVRPSMERACALRAASGQPRFIYVWTVNDGALLREYVRIGVDGIITDDPARLRHIVSTPDFARQVRLATRDDVPFAAAHGAYALTVHTAQVAWAGTDAFLTFTLRGDHGTAAVTVDAQWGHRMESGRTDYVTLRSADLGPLQSLTVSLVEQGMDSDWRLERIEVASERYGARHVAAYDRRITHAAAVTVPLLPRPPAP